jgi:hypothetical protein
MSECLCSLSAGLGAFPLFLMLFTAYYSGKAIWNNKEPLARAVSKIYTSPESAYQAVKSRIAAN